jgi:hypothetical protein
VHCSKLIIRELLCLERSCMGICVCPCRMRCPKIP